MEHTAPTFAAAARESAALASPPPNPLLADPAFQSLVRARRRFAWALTAIMLAVYFGYILTLAFRPALLGRQLTLGQPMSVGIPVGFGMFALTFLLVAVYVHRTNTVYDQRISEIKQGATK
ncbi:DUF485 domain-containing protein [Cupriavidus basilensis]|uniref:DUF485 domain-containing protein n=1 Tax=Cupriavidus basilensis TaxID=68895 RepID=UPI0020A6BA29|nr:DUF485 domain-containing protein [Cupriavidus basilensis]MCP3024369.1 DUF485 domain-containing protein [Cupriavidus basilensis]MDR3384796.1 DUF485 domain-containing protein [Cupriavidus basilensis]